jgi:hypothetical protein
MMFPRYARLAARLVAREWAPACRPTLGSRARAIELIRHALTAKNRRHARRVRIVGGLAVAAAAVLGFVSVRQLSHRLGVAITVGGCAGATGYLNNDAEAQLLRP